jgi:hypothetical protein
MDSAAQGNRVAIRSHLDPARVDLSAPNQCFLNVRLDRARGNRRSDPDMIIHILDTDQGPHRVVRCFALVMVGNIACESQPALYGCNRDELMWNQSVPAQCVTSGPSQVGVGSLVICW